MTTKERKAFDAGFDAGYALGQGHAGEGGYWTMPPTRDEALKEYKKPKKKFKLPKSNFRGVIRDQDIPL